MKRCMGSASRTLREASARRIARVIAAALSQFGQTLDVDRVWPRSAMRVSDAPCQLQSSRAIDLGHLLADCVGSILSQIL